eukprot:3376011-Amphidinium_carterae.1
MFARIDIILGSKFVPPPLPQNSKTTQIEWGNKTLDAGEKSLDVEAVELHGDSQHPLAHKRDILTNS